MHSRIINYLSRWRHGKGFGIHSPFAYRFVTEVLREQLHYYGYARIAEHYRHRQHRPHISYHTAKTLFRVINYFSPERIMLVGEVESDLLREIALQVSHKTRFVTGAAEADMVIVSQHEATSALATQCLEAIEKNRATVIFVSRRSDTMARAWQQVVSTPTFGMTFCSSRKTPSIFVPNPKLPRQDFSVLF
jgi:hypothetical protein